jgi:pimeloyl-ACP methyl ester carboxylesterase
VEGGASELRPPPEEAARRNGFFRAAQRIELPGAGHMMQRHAPEALARALLAFFAERG